MALFKISKGLAANLPTTYNEGYCYFTTDDGKFYIDTTSAAAGRIVLNANAADKVNIQDDTSTKLYLLGATATGQQSIYRESSVYMENDVLMGAAWNDYAEYRQAAINEPGRVVREDASGIMQLATERLMPACEIISDTFGFAIGYTDDCRTPIATTGRVLAYPDADPSTFALGDAVCSGVNGTVSKMTREEIREYPERILGTVSEIPNYLIWGQRNIQIKGRIWIRIR